MEYGRAERLHPALKRFVDGPRHFERVAPPPPMQRGSFTVRHMLDATKPEDYVSRAEEWASSVWKAWNEQQDQARLWVKQALAANAKG